MNEKQIAQMTVTIVGGAMAFLLGAILVDSYNSYRARRGLGQLPTATIGSRG